MKSLKIILILLVFNTLFSCKEDEVPADTDTTTNTDTKNLGTVYFGGGYEKRFAS